MTKTQILFRGHEESALKKTQVESFPVKADKKLSSIAQVVGDFSLIPTTAVDLIGLIGNHQLEGISIPTSTKSARKGWRLTAKW
jgi:hypothetical protein